MNPATSAPPTACPRLNGHFRLQFETAQDAWVLLYPEGMIRLNPSAGEILRRCDGSRDIPAIVAELETLFDTRGLDHDVRAFLDMAGTQRWITLS